ncbi:MAG: ribonuclease HII [Acidimicrobiia bacterium]|nr:ribonuclease HII [Acidimicrobiia bacterium]
MPNVPRVPPTLEIERRLFEAGQRWIAGVDEVGVGAIAGPVIAGAVVLPLDQGFEVLLEQLGEVRDSNHTKRYKHARLGHLIRQIASPDVAVGIVEVAELEKIRDQNRATTIASNRALAGLPHAPEVVLLDGGVSIDAAGFDVVQVPKVVGGTPALSIAAASIVAMVAIAEVMSGYAERYPGFGFERHSGYPNSEHLDALAQFGRLPVHHSFHRFVQGR